jgi:hypothetical protein
MKTISVMEGSTILGVLISMADIALAAVIVILRDGIKTVTIVKDLTGITPIGEIHASLLLR